MGHYDSFVVRVWVDDTEDITRGYIQHVGTQETMHFYDLNKINEFILSHIHLQSNNLEDEQARDGSHLQPL
jgi:hypothetical protein